MVFPWQDSMFIALCRVVAFNTQVPFFHVCHWSFLAAKVISFAEIDIFHDPKEQLDHQAGIGS